MPMSMRYTIVIIFKTQFHDKDLKRVMRKSVKHSCPTIIMDLLIVIYKFNPSSYVTYTQLYANMLSLPIKSYHIL